jgi:predicted sugar kinase
MAVASHGHLINAPDAQTGTLEALEMSIREVAVRVERLRVSSISITVVAAP